MKLTSLTRMALLSLCLSVTSPSHAAEKSSAEQLPVDSASGQSLLSANLSTTADKLVLSFSTEETPTVWTHIYLQTDGDAATGHRHFSSVEGRQGMDYLVEGDALYIWSGKDDQRGWHWERVPNGTLTRTVNSSEVTIEIPLAILEYKPGQEIGAFVETMTDNFQAPLDLLPREEGVLLVKAPAKPELKAASPPSKDARQRFKKIDSYACYYGSGQTEALATRGAVIIETRSQTPEALAAIKEKGSVVIGYISAGEDAMLRKGDGKGPGGFDSAYYDRNADGKPDKNEIWSSYFTDARTESWINFFLGEARRLKKEYGVDGFFLDTVETFTLYTENRQAMIDLIRRLREENPESVIVLNRGWDILPSLADTVDGLMYESLTLSYDFPTKSYVYMRPSALDEGKHIYERFLKPAQDSHGLVVLALDYAADPKDPTIQDAVDRAVSFGMVPEVSTIYLDTIYPRHFTGRKSDKWFKDFLTPESMSFVTEKPTNGFPSGTRILPSSIYGDYAVTPVVDGLKDKKALGWRDRAWASTERPDPHWLEFKFPKPQPISELKVVWATDNGESFPSRNFSVQVQSTSSKDEWKTVWSTNANLSKTVLASFPQMEAERVRIQQESEGGSTGRPNLMWVEQVELIK